MSYHYKIGPELGWLIATTAILALAQVLLTFDPATITDWQTWALSLAGAVVRAVAGAVLAYRSDGFVKPGQDRDR